MGASDTDRRTEPFALDESGSVGPSMAKDTERLLAGLAYISQIVLPGVLPAILLLAADSRGNAFVRHHARQSLGLLVASILYYLGASLVYAAASAIAGCTACILWVLFLLPAGVIVYYGYLAFRGDLTEIPWLSGFMRQNGWL